MIDETARTPIPILYSSKHIEHAPKVEFFHGRLLDYPEVPVRIENMKSALIESGMTRLIEPVTPLPESAILKVHDAGMIAHVKNIRAEIEKRSTGRNSPQYRSSGEDELYLYPRVFASRPFMRRLRESSIGQHGYYFFDIDAPIGTGTWEAALYAATLAYEGAEMLLRGETKAIYALCRPPGHHAGRDFMGGYCYLNNAAIAAAHLMQTGKIAVLDIDYHHGNGTQSIFWDEPNVLFGSIHAHPDYEYPYYSGHADETGGESALNTNVNLPMQPGTDSDEFLAAFDQLLRRTRDFGAKAIVLSIGYDTYIDDPLSTFKVTEETYQQVGAALMQSGLPVLIVQEGGYQVNALGELAVNLLRGVHQG